MPQKKGRWGTTKDNPNLIYETTDAQTKKYILQGAKLVVYQAFCVT